MIDKAIANLGFTPTRSWQGGWTILDANGEDLFEWNEDTKQDMFNRFIVEYLVKEFNKQQRRIDATQRLANVATTEKDFALKAASRAKKSASGYRAVSERTKTANAGLRRANRAIMARVKEAANLIGDHVCPSKDESVNLAYQVLLSTIDTYPEGKMKKPQLRNTNGQFANQGND